MDERLIYIADYYGLNSQMLKTVEELNELGVKLAKSIEKNYLRVDAIEEIADVEIMLEQVKYLASISPNDIEETKEYKINRQLERIKGNLEKISSNSTKGEEE